MARRLIGSGTTDENGNIIINYMGTGAGKINLIAVNGTLESNTYDLYDTQFYCHGLNTDYNDNWILGGDSDFLVERSSTGTTLTNVHNNTSQYTANKPGTGSNVYDWTPPFTVELDVVNCATQADLQVYDQTYNAVRSMTNLGITTNNHLKIVVDTDSIKYYVDGVEKTTQQYDYTMGTSKVSLRSNSGSITYRNFKIY